MTKRVKKTVQSSSKGSEDDVAPSAQKADDSLNTPDSGSGTRRNKKGEAALSPPDVERQEKERSTVMYPPWMMPPYMPWAMPMQGATASPDTMERAFKIMERLERKDKKKQEEEEKKKKEKEKKSEHKMPVFSVSELILYGPIVGFIYLFVFNKLLEASVAMLHVPH